MAAMAGGAGGDENEENGKKLKPMCHANVVGGYVSSDGADDEDLDENEAFNKWSLKMPPLTQPYKVIRKPKTDRDVRWNRNAMESRKLAQFYATLPHTSNSEMEDQVDENGAPYEPAWDVIDQAKREKAKRKAASENRKKRKEKKPKKDKM